MKIRRGGVQTARGFLFELTGGRLCLDFANTVDNRPTAQPKELLGSYSDLLSWSVQAGALQPADAGRLARLAGRRAPEADRVLRRAREIREAIFGVFSDLEGGRRTRDQALAVLEDALPRALSRLRLVPAKGRFEWGWTREEDALDAMLWPVIKSTAELLTSGELERVRECAAAECAWLFIDGSRNGTRRWCDMTVCGNRNKARRFYSRSKPSSAAGKDSAGRHSARAQSRDG